MISDDGDRPRVFDPDTGETLGDAGGDPLPETVEPPGPRTPVRIWARAGIAVVVALVVGAAGGVSWQRHRDTSARDSSVTVTVRVPSQGIQIVTAGQSQVVPLEVDNSGPTSVSVTSLVVKGAGGVTGRSSNDNEPVPANSSAVMSVPLSIRCGEVSLSALDATLEVETPDGHTHTVQTAVDLGGSSLQGVCASNGDTSQPTQPQAVVTGFRATATGFVATVRVTIANGAPPTSVTVEAVPLTPDPVPAVGVKAGTPTDITVTLTPKNACFRSQSWQNIPTTFTVSATQSTNEVTGSDLLLPYALYRGVIHDLDVMCPTSGTGK